MVAALVRATLEDVPCGSYSSLKALFGPHFKTGSKHIVSQLYYIFEFTFC